MLSKIYSAVNEGLDSYLVEVETDICSGMPAFEIVGLPDKAVSEAKERVHSAIVNSGFRFLPDKKRRLIINLAPADIKKEGSVYDLPIALGILLASGQISCQVEPDNQTSSQVRPVRKLEDIVNESIFIGELSLNGELRHTKGVLPMVILAKKKNLKNVFVPKDNAEEAALVEGINVCPLNSLKDLFLYLSNQEQITPFKSTRDWTKNLSEIEYEYDFKYIKGQEFIKRALEIAAAGGHNVLMVGSPGSGKTLLARAIPSIMPLMDKEEVLEVTKIYSVAGLLKQNEYLKNQRPFRSPHHTTSDVAMVGGGQVPHPGEVSLAHRGVLFLDELAHFKRQTLESLRQPLEDGEISVARARGSVSYPAKFILIASMNPCPCGYYGDPERECKCTIGEIVRYRRKISGPFLDRVDIHLEVPRVKIDKLMTEEVAESSEKVRERVTKARQIQSRRFGRFGDLVSKTTFGGCTPSKASKVMTNAEMNITQIKKFCRLDKAGEELLKNAMEKFTLSARAYHRILKVARTIADLSVNETNSSTRRDLVGEIKTEHLAEAIQYRVQMNEESF